MDGPKTFEEIYIQHWGKLYAFCYKSTGDSSLSKNIVQDIFTDLWERQHQTNIISIESYLFRSAKNQIFKTYRQQKFDTTPLDERFEHFLSEEPDPEETDQIDELYRLLDKLPQKRRQILIMNKLEQMNIDEIAERLGISVQTVKNQLSAGLKQLRQLAGDYSAKIMLLVGVLTIL